MNAEAETIPQDDTQLDDLMLAMDVVDTLRHQQSLVEHALSADERDAALTARIRKIYADQGIAVTDEVIANGVKALREERFTYREPPAGVQTWLAKCYVRRQKVYKPIAGVLAALGVWWGANFAFNTLPEQREIEAAMRVYNSQVVNAQSDTIALKNRLKAAGTSVQAAPAVSSEFRDLVPAIQRDTKTALDKATELRGVVQNERLESFTDGEEFSEERLEAEASLARYQSAIGQLEDALEKIESNDQLLAALDRMPAEVKDLANAVKTIGAEPAVAVLARTHLENTIAALKAGDVKGASQEKRALENLLNEVKASYQILIVSEPGEKTGVWRYPEQNNRVRNYYLVVEAVTREGQRLSRPVVSEEDGKTYQVKRWAMRVNEKTYNQIAADKGDDGIVQQKLFGEKARGYINPRYFMNTTGASIVSW